MGDAIKHSGTGRNLIDRLDALIEAGFDNVMETAKEQVTIGEFLKMVDMRLKLSAKEPGNKEFWDMLERIRKEQLDDKKPVCIAEGKQQAETEKVKTA